MKKIFFGAMVIASFLFLMISPESFTKKKIKSPTHNELKEKCGYACADLIATIAKTQEQLAQLQQELLQKSRELLEGSDGFFNAGKKDDLGNYLSKLSHVEQVQKSFDKEIQLLCSYSANL